MNILKLFQLFIGDDVTHKETHRNFQFKPVTALCIRHSNTKMAVMKTCCGCFSTKSGTFAILLLYAVILLLLYPDVVLDNHYTYIFKWNEMVGIIHLLIIVGSLYCLYCGNFDQPQGRQIRKMVQGICSWFEGVAGWMFRGRKYETLEVQNIIQHAMG